MVSKKSPYKNKDYEQIKQLSNEKKFKIIQLVENERKNITELSKEVELAYNKCSNYVTDLVKKNLVVKEKEGKYIYVKKKK